MYFQYSSFLAKQFIIPSFKRFTQAIITQVDLPCSGPIIWDRHEPLYASTATVSNNYNILHLQTRHTVQNHRLKIKSRKILFQFQRKTLGSSMLITPLFFFSFQFLQILKDINGSIFSFAKNGERCPKYYHEVCHMAPLATRRSSPYQEN